MKKNILLRILYRMFYLELHHDLAIFIAGMRIRQIIYFHHYFYVVYLHYSFITLITPFFFHRVYDLSANIIAPSTK